MWHGAAEDQMAALAVKETRLNRVMNYCIGSTDHPGEPNAGMGVPRTEI
jgi:hypothetical protein